MRISRAIFVESTICKDELTPLLREGDLVFPSIRRGDLVRLYLTYPLVSEVVLIDGVFEQHPSITHKEILWLIAKGIRVVGISSMGALRAYELRYDGMIGYV